MKFLLDQNISFRVSQILNSNFIECKHISDVGLVNSIDLEIWNYAKTINFIIVTHDTDFDDFAVKNGHPPKIIRLNTGNISSDMTAEIIIKHINEIESFIANNEMSLLLLTK